MLPLKYEVGEELITKILICEPSQNHHQLNTTDEDDALYYGIDPKLEPTID